MTPWPYAGRFAPSPTGPLHLGSLVTAVASFLDARAHQGRWLLRIEDIDPPREIPGAAALIARQLDAHGLHWDGPICYQSQRIELYHHALATLTDQGLLYVCDCGRQRLLGLGGRYDGNCRARKFEPGAPLPPAALRIAVTESGLPEQRDFLLDTALGDPVRDGDFIVRRRDGLIAYQLAVAIDDAEQGITHVLRGADLFASTPRQRFVLEQLGLRIPAYGHVPLVLGADGQKLSKQNRAPPLVAADAAANLSQALRWLGLAPPPEIIGLPPVEQLAWGVRNWSRDKPIKKNKIA